MNPRRALPDVLVVILVVATSAWLMVQERQSAAVQATRLIAVERRELVATHLQRTLDELKRVAAGLAAGSRPTVDDADVVGLWVLARDGSVQEALAGEGKPAATTAEVAAGADAWHALAVETLPGGMRVLRLVGPVRAKSEGLATGVLLARVNAARLVRLLETPVDKRFALAASLCVRQGGQLHRLDTAAGQAIPDGEIARALGGEEVAVARKGAAGQTFVIAQQRIGVGTWAVVVRAALADAVPVSSFPPYVAIPLLVALSLFAILLRQPQHAPAPPPDPLGLNVVTPPPFGAPPPPPVRPAPEVQLLNRGRLEILRKAVGTSVMTELVGSFSANLPKRIEGIRGAFEQGDAEGVATRGHSLFGSSANLGLDRLSAVGNWLDTHARGVAKADLAAAVEVVEAEADAGLRALAAFVAEQPAELDRCLAAMAEIYVRVDEELVIRAHSARGPQEHVPWMFEGKSFLDSAGPGDRERLRDALRQLAAGPRREFLEVRAAGRDENKRIAWSLARAPGGTGGALAFGREVATRDADGASLAAARDDALAALRARSDFIAAVTHELRTPLNAVIGMTGLLLATELSGEQKDCAQVVRLGAENLLALVNDILDFSKIEAGRMELESMSFGLLAAVDDVIDLLALKASQRKVRLNVEADPGLPTAVRGDQGRLRQILINLTDNALKFTGEGGLVTVRLRKLAASGSPATAIRFEVQDTGAGIPPDVLGRLFQPFTQADASTTRRFGGTGLGLAICKQLVELMGGGIGVDSKVGIGSTFWFAVPLPEASESEVAAYQDTRAEGGTLEPMPFPLRALVVDDNAINQLVATRILERLNVKTDVAGSGREALEMLQLLPYDMIFMDYQMPDMDGREATRQIRKLDIGKNKIPIIGLTANAAADTREACIASGMDDFLAKPVVPATLRAAVVRWAPQAPRVSWRDATTGAADAVRGIFADTPNTGQHFDRSRFRQIQELAKQHTDSFFLNVVEVYLTSTQKNLEILKRAVAAQQRQLAGEAAVALRRASEHMGAVVLAEQCRAFEDELAAGGELTGPIAQIEREVQAIAGVLTPRR